MAAAGMQATSPHPPPLPTPPPTPQEGAKLIADSVSRYEYEVFSGVAVSAGSEALIAETNLLLAAARALGLIKNPPVQAVHEFVLQVRRGAARGAGARWAAGVGAPATRPSQGLGGINSTRLDSLAAERRCCRQLVTLRCRVGAVDPLLPPLRGSRPPPARHPLPVCVQAPDGSSRTFRVGTDTAAVPVRPGERCTVVSTPVRNVRQGGIFSASVPGTKPGQALQVRAWRWGQGAHYRMLQPCSLQLRSAASSRGGRHMVVASQLCPEGTPRPCPALNPSATHHSEDTTHHATHTRMAPRP